jgi:hypothetical protein
MTQEEPKYPIGGYAPGNYMCYCSTCKIEFQGDKRACQCESCAVAMTKEENSIEAKQRAKNYMSLKGALEPKQERMYSQEDVRFMLSESFKASQEGYNITADEIIEQFKKK